MKFTIRKNTIVGIIAGAIFIFILLSIPAPDPPAPGGAGGKPFAWGQDSTWNVLRRSLEKAKSIGCNGLEQRIDRGFVEGRRRLAVLNSSRIAPDSKTFADLEQTTFNLATMVAICPQKAGGLQDYVELVTRSRSLLKKQSENWDMNENSARDRLYRMLYGGRAALEEVLLQSPAGSYPSLILCDNVPSSTPSRTLRNLTVHSGDILVSRGGAPTSALIARGNDYPGNFSHAALLYIDEKTGEPSIIESHIERGAVISSPDEYIRDKKLRIMVLRLRPDLPRIKADPLLPHKAAKQAYENVRARHIPYDFEMDYKDPSKQFCSEVASAAYRPFGIELWKVITHMSSPGVVKWLSYFGVTHFETQSPADLEYDPQLRVVAEWRDPETLWQDHVDSAVIQAMLEGANAGDAIGYPWWKLAAARLTKAYSAALNLFGAIGPIPEGMDATAALRNMELSDRHAELKKATLARAAAFQEQHGNRPPYWELVRMANEFRTDGRK